MAGQSLIGISITKCNHTRGPFYWCSLTSISAWINNHMPSKVWDEIVYPFSNFNGSTVEVLEWVSNFIPQIIMDVITYLCKFMSNQRCILWYWKLTQVCITRTQFKSEICAKYIQARAFIYIAFHKIAYWCRIEIISNLFHIDTTVKPLI